MFFSGMILIYKKLAMIITLIDPHKAVFMALLIILSLRLGFFVGIFEQFR